MAQYSRERLIALARKAVEEAGGQRLAAEALGVSQAAVGAALTIDPESPRRDATLVAIVERLGGREVQARTVFEVGPRRSSR